MLEDFHKVFIDVYIQTNSIEEAAKRAGIPVKEALSAGVTLMNNPEIQEALIKREEEYKKAYSVVKLDKERLVNIMLTQYERATRLGRIKDSLDILTKIAETQGIDFKTLKMDPINLIINNLDENKI